MVVGPAASRRASQLGGKGGRGMRWGIEKRAKLANQKTLPTPGDTADAARLFLPPLARHSDNSLSPAQVNDVLNHKLDARGQAASLCNPLQLGLVLVHRLLAVGGGLQLVCRRSRAGRGRAGRRETQRPSDVALRGDRKAQDATHGRPSPAACRGTRARPLQWWGWR